MRRRLTTRLAAIAAATVLGLVAAISLTTPSASEPRPTEIDLEAPRAQHAEADHEAPHDPHAAHQEG